MADTAGRSAVRPGRLTRWRRARRDVPGEERRQMLALRRWHVLEVPPPIDDLPKVLAGDLLQGMPNREQPVLWFRFHVLGDGARFGLFAFEQVVRGKLDLRLAHPEQRAFLASCSERSIEFEKVLEHVRFLSRT